MPPLQLHLSSEGFIQRKRSEHSTDSYLFSSAVFTVFRIVLEEQLSLKGDFKIYNIFSSKLVEKKRRKCKEGI